jgi:uncharacterized membrane protein YtjA (UPF0391 family)
MINWSLAFLIVAVLAALFGFGENAQNATRFSEICFALSVALLLFALPTAYKRGRE